MTRFLRALVTSLLLLSAGATYAQKAPTPMEQRWAHPPAGFTVGVLEPLGGRILVPSGWVLMPAHDATAYAWRLVPAGPRKHLDAQLFLVFQAKVDEVEGMSASAMVEKEFKDKKAQATRVIKDCKPSQAGMFTRRCLEIEFDAGGGESQHALLTALYDDNLQMVAFVMAGSDNDKWPKYAPMFDKMAHIELIDMDRFAK